MPPIIRPPYVYHLFRITHLFQQIANQAIKSIECNSITEFTAIFQVMITIRNKINLPQKRSIDNISNSSPQTSKFQIGHNFSHKEVK